MCFVHVRVLCKITLLESIKFIAIFFVLGQNLQQVCDEAGVVKHGDRGIKPRGEGVKDRDALSLLLIYNSW